MIELSYPWLLSLLLLPLAIPYLFAEHKQKKSSIKLPFFKDLINLTGLDPNKNSLNTSTLIQKFVIWLSWTCLIIALARPQFIEAPLKKTLASRDLLLAIDLSGSMETKDFKNSQGKNVSRLDSVKEVMQDFLSRREGDRIGLIYFGSAAFIQMPFTEDLEICREMLKEAQVRMAGPQTMMGDAIGLSISIFEESKLEDKVLILLTDGNDTGSLVPPEKAAQIARDKGIVIHTIAVGDPKAAGEQALDETTLKSLSNITQGKYFWAGNQKELLGIYDEIDKLNTRELDSVSHRPKRELYFWPLACFLIIITSFHFIKLINISRHIKSLEDNNVE
ncbi:VWA domain-containing protein [Lentisphaera profundi]|uniref:VWA domain-containing protein n=1 Tax=Lentisphaera profundi TaxID=1658616 RepID=A0ABY7VTQ8_9BACT|nr:VWA domain-containing protein [Lentisphaera profundi]WDE96206.1 VWA domain-containing protein [Lentisphaera profundi]